MNGFHDTANAIATVIYTHTLKPTYAVVWSGCWNLLGVLLSSGGVAFGILALLPVVLVTSVGSGAGFAMVKRPELYAAPPKDQPPPTWIRGLLMFTCTGVSLFHGSNDGQKSMGLLMLILIGILPAQYSLDPMPKKKSPLT